MFLTRMKTYFKMLRFFVPLNECPMTRDTDFFQMKTHFFIIIYLEDYFSEHFDVLKSKFKQVIFELFNFYY